MTRQNSRSKADRVDPPCMDALLKLPEGRGFTGCGKSPQEFHSEEPQAVPSLATVSHHGFGRAGLHRLRKNAQMLSS
jgi:hypothetical protein